MGKQRSWMPREGKAATDLIDDKRWNVQYHRGSLDEYHRVEIDPKKFHVVQIFRCVDTLVVLKEPCNQVFMNECLNTHVIVEGTVGPVEVSNSEQIELLLNRLTPSVIFSTVKGAVIHVTQEEGEQRVRHEHVHQRERRPGVLRGPRRGPAARPVRDVRSRQQGEHEAARARVRLSVTMATNGTSCCST